MMYAPQEEQPTQNLAREEMTEVHTNKPGKNITQWCEIMVTASAKLLFSALLDSGSRSSLTISQTQCSLTSSLSFSHLKTVRAKTSSAHADSACLR